MQPGADNAQTYFEALVLGNGKFICQCGEARIPTLILMFKGGILMMKPGPPRTRSVKQRDDRAMLVIDQPELWFALCHNCYQTMNNRSPGRPKIYTDAERIWRKKNQPRISELNTLTKVIQSYGIKGEWPTCTMCDNPATRTLYVGEFGEAPKGNQALRCRRAALTDPYWHRQFLPYCDHHEVSNIGQRHAEVKRRMAEHINLAIYKSTLTLAELEALYP